MNPKKEPNRFMQFCFQLKLFVIFLIPVAVVSLYVGSINTLIVAIIVFIVAMILSHFYQRYIDKKESIR